jgi:hypothetical protein
MVKKWGIGSDMRGTWHETLESRRTSDVFTEEPPSAPKTVKLCTVLLKCELAHL